MSSFSFLFFFLILRTENIAFAKAYTKQTKIHNIIKLPTRAILIKKWSGAGVDAKLG